MSTATLSHPVRLIERDLGMSGRVDRNAGVIRGVGGLLAPERFDDA